MNPGWTVVWSRGGLPGQVASPDPVRFDHSALTQVELPAKLCEHLPAARVNELWACATDRTEGTGGPARRLWEQ